MGRDKGRLCVVLYEMDADFVWITDGRTHPVDHPKKKRRKHLMTVGYELPEIISLYEQKVLKDSDVRKALIAIAEACPNGAKGGRNFCPKMMSSKSKERS
jgi:ribosomal protein L14E/L6E/L27E